MWLETTCGTRHTSQRPGMSTGYATWLTGTLDTTCGTKAHFSEVRHVNWLRNMAYRYTRHNMQHKAHFSEARHVNWLRNMAYRYVTVYTYMLHSTQGTLHNDQTQKGLQGYTKQTSQRSYWLRNMAYYALTSHAR